MIYELTGIIALWVLGCGLYLQYGCAISMIVIGFILLALSIVGARQAGQ